MAMLLSESNHVLFLVFVVKPKPKPAEAKPEPASPTPAADKDEKQPQSKEGGKEGENTAMDEDSKPAGDDAK